MKIITEERRRNSFCGNLHPDGPLFQYSQSDRPARQQHRAVVCRGAIRDKAGTGSDGKHDAENL